MKTSALVFVASLGASAAFAPVSSFNGAAVTASVRASNGPVMLFGKKPAAKPAPKQASKPASSKPVSKPASKPVSKPASKPAAKPAPAKPTPKPKAPPAPVASLPIEFGSDVEAPFWDPAQLAADKPVETLNWYRAAELKHGRVAMLAVLGTWINAAGIALPDPVFEGTTKSFDALAKVAAERPGALIQIILGISAVEVLSATLPEGKYPGDLGFDPAKQIPSYESKGTFDELRLKELKNGRLAMMGIAGMWVQEALTGQGVFEQLTSGHISPINDGQGYF